MDYDGDIQRYIETTKQLQQLRRQQCHHQNSITIADDKGIQGFRVSR
jgi:hypothetical protein